MTKLTLKNEYGTYSVSNKEHNLPLDDLLYLINQLIKAAGYYPSGELFYEDIKKAIQKTKIPKSS